MATFFRQCFFLIVCLVQNKSASGGELEAKFVPVEDASQCADHDSCDDSTPGTGHVLFSTLEESVWAVEHCFSFCSKNASQGQGLSVLSNFYDDSGEKCQSLQDVYVCLAACLYSKTSSIQAVNVTAGSSGGLQGGVQDCSSVCNVENGICERAFSPRADPACVADCKSSNICAHYCRLAGDLSPSDNFNLPLDVDGNLFLDLPSPDEDYSLYSQGALIVKNKTSLSIDHYGIMWKVSMGQNEEYYIPQHLPFILLPGEVGPLYRSGSNMLAIRQFQCRQDLNLSYALVTASGRSNFSQPLSQCFYGNGFPRPPSGIHVKYGFKEMSSDLKIEISVDQLSPDHTRVTGYGVQVYATKNGNTLTRRTLFPDKENLSLVLTGDDADATFSVSKDTLKYLVGVYALPQRSVSESGRALVPASNWAIVDVEFPTLPALNGTTCYTATFNRSSNRSELVFQYSVHSGWRSLAPVVSLKGSLLTQTIMVSHGFRIARPKSFFIPPILDAEVDTFHYVFTFENVGIPDDDKETFKFFVTPNYIYRGLSGSAGETVTFDLKAFKGNATTTEINTCPVVTAPPSPSPSPSPSSTGDRDNAGSRASVSGAVSVLLLALCLCLLFQ